MNDTKLFNWVRCNVLLGQWKLPFSFCSCHKLVHFQYTNTLHFRHFHSWTIELTVMKFSTMINIDGTYVRCEGQGRRSKGEVTRSKILFRTMQIVCTLTDKPLDPQPQNLVGWWRSRTPRSCAKVKVIGQLSRPPHQRKCNLDSSELKTMNSCEKPSLCSTSSLPMGFPHWLCPAQTDNVV